MLAAAWVVAASRAVFRPLEAALRLLGGAAAFLLRPATVLGSPVLRGLQATGERLARPGRRLAAGFAARLRTWLFPPDGGDAGGGKGPE